jgi:Cu(I)/Ag(I) efflux system membrane protein CusA/SilA
MINRFIKFFLENKLITIILLVGFVIWGILTSPFDWDLGDLPTDQVHVDAIPDIGENQQIVFTPWPGRSPQDIEDQITYPLTTTLLGIPGVKTIRSSSMFGFSSIYIIFDDKVEFYWSRSRILEKLNSLPGGLLPEDVQPALGPDATALGQIFWYTLEGRDKQGNPTGGWDLQELRSIQDYFVRYSLSAVEGVSEVASIGGHVKEYQVDINPVALAAYNLNLMQVINGIKNSNLDVGARTIEINQAEYFIRGIGYVKSLSDIEEVVISSSDNVPIRIKDVAVVSYGPAERRGVLDKMGAEVAGGVVVARYGSNPMIVIENVKEKIEQIAPGLPSRELEDGTLSKLTIVPFYDRSGLIRETLGTLEEALSLEVIITIIVIIIMVMNLRASLLISALIPIAVLMSFIAMRYTNIDANIVALSGIAIAIGTIVDIGIVLSENMIRHLENPDRPKSLLTTIYNASAEVSSAVITAVMTTIISFIPVFTLQAAEGKLFHPLAFTKTYVLIASLIVAIVILPALGHWLFSIKVSRKITKIVANTLLAIAGILYMVYMDIAIGMIILLLAAINLASFYRVVLARYVNYINIILVALAVAWFLAERWLPLGASKSMFSNYLFVVILIALLLGIFLIIVKYYERILQWALTNKGTFLSIPALLLLWGLLAWTGFDSLFGFVANGTDKIGMNLRQTNAWNKASSFFPGTMKEFMPSLDEGSFLLMPTSMPHAGIEENKRVLKQLDMAVAAIPEIDMVVGKLGRVESPLDPAPISMYENVINYKNEYRVDENGHRVRFKVDRDGNFARDDQGQLIPHPRGRYFRQWRDHIKTPDDIWNEIVNVTRIPGVTSAPKLQPIETRLVMLQTGMRAPIGIKVMGSDLEMIEAFGLKLEVLLKEVEGVSEPSVFAERIVGKPYIELRIKREAIARYGLNVKQVQTYIETSIGGMILSTTVEGRERYPIRIRYPRELRDTPEKIGNILVPAGNGTNVQLKELVTIEYLRGPQVIKSENTFYVGYVIFDKTEGISEVQVVERARDFLSEKIDEGSLVVPAGITYRFTGNYENQLRAEKRLSLVIPIVLIIIFLILYFQFRETMPTLLVFSGIAVAFSGGFIMIWLYGQEWFLNFSMAGLNIRDILQVKTVYLSVAVWVGFIALFGIATDDGVLMTTYLQDVFKANKPKSVSEVHKAVIEAGSKRIRPCLMTTATTILALLPILTSTGRGSDVMVPMAIPAFGGMTIEIITLFVVPVLYSTWKEKKIKKINHESQ